MQPAALALTGVALAGLTSVATEPGGVARAQPRTTIVIEVDSNRGRAPTRLLGANHHFDANGRRLWDGRVDAPVPVVVRRAARAGLDALRFPGGTVANMYDWKRAIGPEHGCQVVGPHGPGDQGRAITAGLAFGPDELMRFVEKVGARANLMVPFVNETPGDAADWVEYMNSPASVRGNPNGGVDWADLRAAHGHPRPYGVKWWELGNEQHHGHSRYWMAAGDGRALRQYAFGGSRVIRDELLGKECAHPRAGIRSDGAGSQTFEVLYPPVAPRSLEVVIADRAWTRVRSLRAAGPRDRVYTLDAEEGVVRFGDGVHGAVPAAGRRVGASYRSVHAGYFEFARRMKQVDPSIKVCSSWGVAGFARVAGRRDFDCLSAHAIVLFTSPGSRRARWSGPLEGHHRFMIKTGSVRDRIRELRGTLPPGTPLILTEFVTMHGDKRAYPAWGTSVSHALYMSSVWAAWMNMRIPWGNGDDFLWAGERGVLGQRPGYTFTADAVTRQALAPMFSAGGAVLATRILGNPVRRPGVTAPESYPALTVSATRADGALHLLVVNRTATEAVSARVRLHGRRARGAARVRTVTGRSFTSWNRPGRPPDVVLRTRTRRIGATGFDHRFPAASTTVFRIPLR